MKAASGELNLTVITIVAISAIIGVFWWLLPRVKGIISKGIDGMEDTKAIDTGKNTRGISKWTTYIVVDGLFD